MKTAYAPAMTGRALSLFTMAMFLGVGLMQSVTGAIATSAAARGVEPYLAVHLGIALLLVGGALAYLRLPQPPRPG